jgi:hypothetical protein
MEITIKLNEKLIKQILELKMNNGRRMEKRTFEKIRSLIEWKYRSTLNEVSEEMEFQTILQLVKSYDYLESTIHQLERINNHNKRLKLKDGEIKSGYWVDSNINHCPKCNKYISNDLLGKEYPEDKLKEMYQKDFKENYHDILEFGFQCYSCGIDFVEVYSKNGSKYEFHKIQ